MLKWTYLIYRGGWVVQTDFCYCRRYCTCSGLSIVMLKCFKNRFIRSYIDIFILLLCFILYGLNELIFKNLTGSISWIFNGYFNDLLAPIILLSYSNILLHVFLNKVYFNFIILSAFILLVGCFWEYITPFYKVSTPDPFDIITYYIGFIMYWLIRNLAKERLSRFEEKG